MTSPRLEAAAASTRSEADARAGMIPDQTPWKVHPGTVVIGPYNKGLMVGPSGTAAIHVIGAFEKADVGADARATAAEIVRRWNSYGAMLAACRAVQDASRLELNSPARLTAMGAALGLVNAAIAQAGGADGDA